MKNFKDKVVWITGASSGIGESLAKLFSVEGAKLVLSSRRREALEKVQKDIGLDAKNCLIVPLDLEENSMGYEKEVQQVLNHFGRLDILINNGGISQRSLFMDTQEDVFRRIMEINFMGAVTLTRSALPALTKQESSQLVAISSVVGKYGTPVRTVYSASKHALNGFYDALRAELWEKNVRVLIVCPGYIKTNISFNALTADGSPQNRMDPGQASGLSSLDCAKQIMIGIKKGKREIYPAGLKELFGLYMKRFFPGLFSILVRKINVR